MNVSYAIVLLISFGLSACGGKVSRFDQQLNAAESARQSGDYATQRARFDEAIQLARSDEERAEALYRKAHSHLRSGSQTAGLSALEELATTYSKTSRAPRAWLDQGRIFEKSAASDKAEICYQKLVSDYPRYGGAPEAARRLVELRQTRGISARVTYQLLREQNRAPELDEALRYYQAAELASRDSTRAAAAFEALAKAYPLPKGRYTDEALLWAAVLQRKNGQPEHALKLLHTLKKQDKQAWTIGSYTRTSYLDAHILSGQILRDDLNHPQKARDEFEYLLKRHDGRTTDEALFELLISDLREGQDTCPALDRLRQNSPNSKYLPCAKRLCSSHLNPSWSEPSELALKHCQRWTTEGTELRTRLRLR